MGDPPRRMNRIWKLANKYQLTNEKKKNNVTFKYLHRIIRGAFTKDGNNVIQMCVYFYTYLYAYKYI